MDIVGTALQAWGEGFLGAAIPLLGLAVIVMLGNNLPLKLRAVAVSVVALMLVRNLVVNAVSGLLPLSLDKAITVIMWVTGYLSGLSIGAAVVAKNNKASW